jgi:hypothetical protein
MPLSREPLHTPSRVCKLNFRDFNCPFPLRQTVWSTIATQILWRVDAARRGRPAADCRLAPSPFQMHATVVTSALFIPYPKLHSPPHGGKALCGRNIFPIVRCPRLLFDPLRVVGERPSEGGVPLVQTFLCIDNPSVSGTSVPARLTSTTLSTAAASSTTAVDGSPRHVSLPSNSVVLSEARVRRGRAQPRPRRVASPSTPCLDPRSIWPDATSAPPPCETRSPSLPRPAIPEAPSQELLTFSPPTLVPCPSPPV